MSSSTYEEVIAVSSYETKSEDGDRTLHVQTLDGGILLITTPNPTKLAELKKASDESKQEDYRDWLRRRGNSPTSLYIYMDIR